MISDSIQHAGVYTDFNGLNTLQSAAAKNTPEAKRETAQQFEALFIQMMLKNMRQASQGDELLGGSQVEMSRDMYDQQLSIELAKNGALGIGDLMLDKMGMPANAQEKMPTGIQQNVLLKRIPKELEPITRPIAFNIPDSDKKTPTPISDYKTPKDFIHTLQPSVETAAQRLGTEPDVILAIAALETGWGQHVLLGQDGVSSNNLFGIKATNNWNKRQVMATTLEFDDGFMQTRREAFRQYDSAEDSIQNFADFLTSNPRYQKALDNADEPQKFIKELQRAGYATDPAYAEKVLSVMQKIKTMTQDITLLADKQIKGI
jgi:flagellar protein FlgJ